MERLQCIVTKRKKWLATSSDYIEKDLPIQQYTGARRRQKKEEEAEEDMAKHFQGIPGRDVC